MESTWKRPESVPFPSTWAIFEGKKAMSNGKKPRFRIQDLTDDLVEGAIHHMNTNFMFDEPYCSYMGIGDEPEALEEFAAIYRQILKFHAGLIAILDNPEELEDDTLPIIAGVNMTFPTFPESKDPELKNKKMRQTLEFVNMASHSVDVFSKYNVQVTLYALGLSVDRAYRGQGLGEQILRARFPLGRALGIPLTTTVFTGATSQGIARKIGFEILAEVLPEEYVEDGKVVYDGVNSKCIQYMATEIK